MSMFKSFSGFLLAVIVPFQLHAAEPIVNIYSAQKEHLIRPILNVFEKASGIQVNLTTGDKSALVSRLTMEGANTPADLLLTVDIGNIYEAKQKGLLQPINSKVLNKHILQHLRDPEGYWYGITMRARSIFYNKDLTDATGLDTYEDLADPKWRKKLLIRSSSNVYNQSLVAFILAKHGEEAALEWAKGVVANMARDPQGGDSDQLRALAAGEGEIAVANTYYYGRLTGNDPSLEDDLVKEKVVIIFPNQEGDGAHVNIRGGGITKYAKHKENAVKLLEFLTEDKAQHFFAKHNLEYPARTDIDADAVVKAWGMLKADPVNLEVIGKLHKKAVAIMDKAGWK